MFPDGRLWEEAAEVQEGHPLHRTLVSLVVLKDDDTTALIGTAFIVEARGRRALAISAAHCFDEIGRLVQGESRSHPMALPQFLPPARTSTSIMCGPSMPRATAPRFASLRSPHGTEHLIWLCSNSSLPGVIPACSKIS